MFLPLRPVERGERQGPAVSGVAAAGGTGAMFRRKLSALDYHNPAGFNCRGEGLAAGGRCTVTSSTHPPPPPPPSRRSPHAPKAPGGPPPPPPLPLRRHLRVLLRGPGASPLSSRLSFSENCRTEPRGVSRAGVGGVGGGNLRAEVPAGVLSVSAALRPQKF